MAERYTFDFNGEINGVEREKAFQHYINLNQSIALASGAERDRLVAQRNTLESELKANNPQLLTEFQQGYSNILSKSSSDRRNNLIRLEDAKDKEQFDAAYKSEVTRIGALALPTVIQLGKGISDIIKGRKDAKGLVKPRYPKIANKNMQLSTRLAEAQRESQQVDPRIKSKRQGDVRRGIQEANEFAKIASGGNTANYAAQGQANAIRGANVLRQGELDDENTRSQKQRLYDFLLSRSMQEDRQLFQDKKNKFVYETNDYIRQQEAANKLSSQAFNNSIQAIVDLANRGSDYIDTKTFANIYGPKEIPQPKPQPSQYGMIGPMNETNDLENRIAMLISKATKQIPGLDHVPIPNFKDLIRLP